MLPCSAPEPAPPRGNTGRRKVRSGKAMSTALKASIKALPSQSLVLWAGCSLQERRSSGAARLLRGRLSRAGRSFRAAVGWCRGWPCRGPSSERWLPFLPDVLPGSLALSPPCAELSCCTWPGASLPAGGGLRAGSSIARPAGPRSRDAASSPQALRPREAPGWVSPRAQPPLRRVCGRRPLRGWKASLPEPARCPRWGTRGEELRLKRERLGAGTRARPWAVVAGGLPRGLMRSSSPEPGGPPGPQMALAGPGTCCGPGAEPRTAVGLRGLARPSQDLRTRHPRAGGECPRGARGCAGDWTPDGGATWARGRRCTPGRGAKAGDAAGNGR